ncbi:EamA family transporter RarD [Clostridiaceae bacterium HSG29]|nr:EamA family transporter RarD [Clostridiaceae bacterium HSG29]
MIDKNDFVKSEKLKGVLFVLLTYLFWGVQPIFWKQLKHIDSIQLIAHRIFWSFLFFLVILKYQNKISEIKEVMKDKKKFGLTVFAGYLISANWFIYIYAINTNRILETSLGYYINPIISVILGMIFLKEKFNKNQILSFIFACLGVLVIIVKFKALPWIAMVLPVMFGAYGLIKKLTNLDPVVSMAIETMAIMPIGLGYLLFTEITNVGHLFSDGPLITFYLIMTGVVTSLPLWWFAIGARKIKLSSIGFIQFISPTISLIIGVLIYNETFEITQMISFGLIGIGIIIYINAMYKENRSL